MFTVTCVCVYRMPMNSSISVWFKWRNLGESWVGNIVRTLDVQSGQTSSSRSGSLYHASGTTPHITCRMNLFLHSVMQMLRHVVCCSCGTQEKYQSNWYYYLSVPLVHNTLDQCLYNTVNVSSSQPASLSIFTFITRYFH